MVQGLGFLSKKSWHVKNIANQEKVWVAEQREEQEKVKAKELAKQIQQEREQEELDKIAGKSGSRVDRGIDWMYHGHEKESEIAKQDAEKQSEEYLLGKEFVPDTVKGDLVAAAEEQAHGLNAATTNAAAAVAIHSTNANGDEEEDSKMPAWSEPSVAERNEAFRMRHEDPMFVVSHQELKKRQEFEQKKELYERVTGKTAVPQGPNHDNKSGKESEDSGSDEKERKRKHKKRHKKERKAHKKDRKARKRERRERNRYYSDDESEGNYDSEDSRYSDRRQKRSRTPERSDRDHGRYRDRHLDRRDRDWDRKDPDGDWQRESPRNDDAYSRRNNRYDSRGGGEHDRMDRRDLRSSRDRDNERYRHDNHYARHTPSRSSDDRYYDRGNNRERVVMRGDNDREYERRRSYEKRSGHEDDRKPHKHSIKRKDPPSSSIKDAPDIHTKPPPKQSGYGLQGASSHSSVAKELGPDRELLQRKREEREAERKQFLDRSTKRPKMTAQERAEALRAMEVNAQQRFDAASSVPSARDTQEDEQPTGRGQRQASFLNDMTRQAHGVSGENGRSLGERLNQNRITNQRRNEGFL